LVIGCVPSEGSRVSTRKAKSAELPKTATPDEVKRPRPRAVSTSELPKTETPVADEVTRPRRRAVSTSGVPTRRSRVSTRKAKSNAEFGKIGDWFKEDNAQKVLKSLYGNEKRSTTPPWFLGIDTTKEKKALDKYEMVISQYGLQDIKMVVDYASVFSKKDCNSHLDDVDLEKCVTSLSEGQEVVTCEIEKYSEVVQKQKDKERKMLKQLYGIDKAPRTEETAFSEAKSTLARSLMLLYRIYGVADPLGEWIDKKWDDNILATVHFSVALISPIERLRVMTVEDLQDIHETSIELLTMYEESYETKFYDESISDIMDRLDYIMEIIEKEQDDEITERQLYRMLAYYVKGHLDVRNITQIIFDKRDGKLYKEFRNWLNEDGNKDRLKSLARLYLLRMDDIYEDYD